ERRRAGGSRYRWHGGYHPPAVGLDRDRLERNDRAPGITGFLDLARYLDPVQTDHSGQRLGNLTALAADVDFYVPFQAVGWWQELGYSRAVSGVCVRRVDS